MIVTKILDSQRWSVTETGIVHPTDGEPVEFTVGRTNGAIYVWTPGIQCPESDEELTISEPNDPDGQARINEASPESLAEWALSAVADYYRGAN